MPTALGFQCFCTGCHAGQWRNDVGKTSWVSGRQRNSQGLTQEQQADEISLQKAGMSKQRPWLVSHLYAQAPFRCWGPWAAVSRFGQGWGHRVWSSSAGHAGHLHLATRGGYANLMRCLTSEACAVKPPFPAFMRIHMHKGDAPGYKNWTPRRGRPHLPFGTCTSSLNDFQ